MRVSLALGSGLGFSFHGVGSFPREVGGPSWRAHPVASFFGVCIVTIFEYQFSFGGEACARSEFCGSVNLQLGVLCFFLGPSF